MWYYICLCIFAGIGNWKVWRMLSQNIRIDHSETLTFIFISSSLSLLLRLLLLKHLCRFIFPFSFDISHYPHNNIICKKTYAKQSERKRERETEKIMFCNWPLSRFSYGNYNNFHPKCRRSREKNKLFRTFTEQNHLWLVSYRYLHMNKSKFSSSKRRK